MRLGDSSSAATSSASSEFFAPGPGPRPAAAEPLACPLLTAALHRWPTLAALPGLEPCPGVDALLQAWAGLPGLPAAELGALARLRPQLPKAVLALDAPAAQLKSAWRRIGGELGLGALPDALRAATGVSPSGLRVGLALLDQLRDDAADWPRQAAGARVDLDALARALAWGALRGSDLGAVDPEAVAAVSALRQLINDLCREGSPGPRSR